MTPAPWPIPKAVRWSATSATTSAFSRASRTRRFIRPRVAGCEAPWTKPWTGRRSSRAAGLVCPQDRAPEPDGLLDEVVFRGTGSLPTHPGEDCHGGGLTGVSSLAAIHYEFANLAEHGDVVVVSINHRLSCFGFLGLTGFGERFAESAGLGMLDVVDALELEM